MHYYLALTSKCNLLCKYCYGKSVEDYLTEEESVKYDFELPDEINFSISELKKYALKDKDFTLTFYGGEPLLKIDLIKKIIDEVPAKTFMMQTNGVFLDKLDKNYLKKISTILVSIDGTKIHTDERRGKGVYDKIISNVKKLRAEGYTGELIARMTVDETCDIYENVIYLLSISEFDSVHWQIDAGFWKSDYELRDFKVWSITNYNLGIKKLVDFWVEEMKTKKKVPRIYPFSVIMYDILTIQKTPMRCGAGHSCLGIQTDGKVVACPITAGFKPLYMGDIRNSSLKEVIANRIEPDKWCLNCEIKDICGGRCLYWNKSNLWPEKGRQEICDNIFFLVNILISKIPEIKKMIKNGDIKIEDFKLPKYNGCEIIP